MIKEFVVTMTLTERKKYDQICKETKEVLVGIAEKIEDSNKRAEFWGKIRNFNNVSEVFGE
jgi:hypothetical protein